MMYVLYVCMWAVYVHVVSGEYVWYVCYVEGVCAVLCYSVA